MSKIKLWNHEITPKHKPCKGAYEKDITSAINLYVQVTNRCNAKCAFCVADCNLAQDPFDFEKYEYILDYLRSKTRINKLGFTGGEPTIDLKRLKNIVDLTIKNAHKDEYLAINTNGLNIRKDLFLTEIAPNLQCITLSRHHWEDKVNSDIFKMPSFSLVDYPLNWKVVLACNLIKGYVANEETVQQYLDYAISHNIRQVGFTGLILANEYCQQNQINITQIDFSKIPQCTRYREMSHEDICACANALYTNTDGCTTLYYKQLYRPDTTDFNLVFDGTNLRIGFTGDILV